MNLRLVHSDIDSSIHALLVSVDPLLSFILVVDLEVKDWCLDLNRNDDVIVAFSSVVNGSVDLGLTVWVLFFVDADADNLVGVNVLLHPLGQVGHESVPVVRIVLCVVHVNGAVCRLSVKIEANKNVNFTNLLGGLGDSDDILSWKISFELLLDCGPQL